MDGDYFEVVGSGWVWLESRLRRPALVGALYVQRRWFVQKRPVAACLTPGAAGAPRGRPWRRTFKKISNFAFSNFKRSKI